MASILNMDILIGASLSVSRRCPTSIGSGSPVISWILPDGFSQKRYNVRIRCLESGSIGYYQSGETVSDSSYHQYPTGSPMNSQFHGLCSVEVAVSEIAAPGAPFEYTTGENVVKFVFDTVSESLFNAAVATLRWNNSYDPDPEQAVTYELMVSREPTFSEPSRIVFSGTVPQNSSATYTIKQVGVDTNTDYFWKVRSYDGFDHSPFTKVNGFINHLNYPPFITIDSVIVTGNNYGDVIIGFTTFDEDVEDGYITASYVGGNAGAQSTPMSLLNAIGKVPNGTHSITWRSGRDERLVSADDYLITLSVTDALGASSSADYGLFSMDNSAIGGETGGIGSVDISFPSSAYMGKYVVVPHSSKENFPAGIDNIMDSPRQQYDSGHFGPGEISVTSWKNYCLGLLSPILRGSVPSVDQYPYFGHAGPAPKGALTMTQGIAGASRTSSGTDLDSGDPLFTSSVEHFGQDGWHVKTNETFWSRDGARSGYVRFVENFVGFRTLCPSCSGKGWRTQDVYQIGEGKYARSPCPTCGGVRFVPTPATKGTVYSVSKYLPVSDWFYPSGNPFSAFTVECSSVSKGKLFFFGSKVAADNEMSTSDRFPELHIQKDAVLVDNKAYSIRGIYPFIEGWNNMAKKYSHNYDPPDKDRPVQGHIGPEITGFSDPGGPFQGDVSHGKYRYVPGYSDSESEYFTDRPEPVHRWERGMWPMQCKISRRKAVEPLQIIYLQSGWDAYNTIHWQATMSNLTRIHLQVAKLFPDGSRTEYVDVRSELSSFESAANAYLVEPNLWHTYWDTARKQILDEGYDYRMRIRQFDLATKTFSQWVYSSKFVLNHEGSNPANVTSTEYEIWGNRLRIHFRLDDTQNDSYNVTRAWFAREGEEFSEIAMADISGDLVELSSKEGKNLHSIVWSSLAYSLEPYDRYRIMIEVIPTKMIGAMSDPILNFSQELNPAHTKAEKEIINLSGYMQTYVYDQNSGQFELLPSGILVPGQIQRTEDEIAAIESYPPPSGKYAFIDPSGNVIDPSGYSAWQMVQLYPGTTRRSALMSLAQERNNLVSVELPRWREEMANAERRVRKRLIDQGYYCNGFIDNDPEAGIFRFRVESMGFGEDVINPDGSYKITYDPRYEPYSRIQMDFFLSFDSQDGSPLRDFMFGADGERIKGSDWNKNAYETPDGTVDNTKFPVKRTWLGFGDDAGPWASGTIANGLVNPSDAIMRAEDQRRRYVSFTIPKSQLPGELDSDTIPAGKSSFETEYVWRSVYYNVVEGEERDVPRHEVGQMSLQQGVKITVPYAMKGGTGVSTATMGSAYYSIGWSAVSLQASSEVEFPTDRPEGHEEMTDDNPVLWTPGGKNRSRPAVVFDGSTYYMWYSKDTSSSEPGVVHARGRNFDAFGEYSVSAPPVDGEILEDYIEGCTSAFAPCVLKSSSVWRMWFTAMVGSSTKIYTSTSADADAWSAPSAASGLPSGAYSPFVIDEGGTFTMWYCALDGGVSKIFRATSSDGISFSPVPGAVFSTPCNLNTPSVIKRGGSYLMFYTRYNSDNGRICLRTSSDKVSWSAETVAVDSDGSINPYAAVATEDGVQTPRLFYNTVSGEDIRIRCCKILDRTWTQVPAYCISGDTSEIESSEKGISHSIEIMLSSAPAELKNLSSVSSLQIRLIFSNDADTRQYLVQSDWANSGTDDTYGSVLEPEVFIYNENIKGLYFKDDEISSSRFARGVSPRVTVSCEECSWNKAKNDSIPDVLAGMPRPPRMGEDNATSESFNLWRQWYPDWSGMKISEPLYDGISNKTGKPSNRPDYISSFHLISMMRSVERFVQPAYVANIEATATMPVPYKPIKAV